MYIIIMYQLNIHYVYHTYIVLDMCGLPVDFRFSFCKYSCCM